jgi:uncharacterized RDD family membrane protein YckC
VTTPTIDEPQVASYEIASLGRRSAALLIDAVIFALLMVVLFFVQFWVLSHLVQWLDTSIALNANLNRESTSGNVFAVAVFSLVIGASAFVYWSGVASTDGEWRGTTLGKRAAGIRVDGAGGEPVTREAMRRRTLVFIGPVVLGAVAGAAFDLCVSSAPWGTIIGLGAGYGFLYFDVGLEPVSDALRRTRHDRMADTIVVRARPDGEPAGGRVRRGATDLYLLVGTGILALVLFLLISSGFADPPPQRVIEYGNQPYDPTQGQTQGKDGHFYPYVHVDAIHLRHRSAGSGSTYRAQDIARVQAQRFMNCFHTHDYVRQCVSSARAGLGRTRFDRIGSDGPRGGAGLRDATGLFTSDHRHRVSLLAYDRTGRGWGFEIREHGVFVAICRSVRGARCTTAETGRIGRRFLHDQVAVQQLKETYALGLFD